MKHWWVPGPADRLRAHVHPPVRRFRAGARRRQEPSAPRSATAWRPITSPMRCSSRRKSGNGKRFKGKSGKRRQSELKPSASEKSAAGLVQCTAMLCGALLSQARELSRSSNRRPARRRVGKVARGPRGGGGATRARRSSFEDRTGFKSIFDGTMKGWDGDPDLLAGRRRHAGRDRNRREPAQGKHLRDLSRRGARRISS